MAAKLEDLARNLEAVNITEELSFANKQLRVNTEEDAKPILSEIEKTARIVALRLTGNTIGVHGCDVIGKALSKHAELERLLCSDMFTGRLKEEIAPALTNLTNGVREAGAHIVELDFSDNAFGPNGICGLTGFISSPSCTNLTVLRLNNNGLGINGAKMLAESLVDSSGEPVCRLHVFVAGRNRLENEGIRRLSSVFARMRSLEELAVPQNGIQAVGIEALSEAIAVNHNLRVLNLNDNTLAQRGSAAVARALLSLPELGTLNLGDCLLRNEGALKLAESLKQLGQTGYAKELPNKPSNGLKLRELVLEGNEIRESGAVAICESLVHCTALERVTFDSNELGESALETVRAALKSSGRSLDIASFEECVSADEDEEEEDGEDEDEEEDGSANQTALNESSVADSFSTPKHNGNVSITPVPTPPKAPAGYIFADPLLGAFVTGMSTLNSLDKSSDLAELKRHIIDAESFAISALLVKIGVLWESHNKQADQQRLRHFIDDCVKPAFAARVEDSAWFTEFTNDFLSRLGFIKNELKTKPEAEIGGQLSLASYLIEKRYVTRSFCKILKCFLQSEHPVPDLETHRFTIKKLMEEIDKYLALP